MRNAHKALFVLAGAIVLVGLWSIAPSAAQQPQTLDGWGLFKFGMPDKAAHEFAAPGQPWKYEAPAPRSAWPESRTFSWLGSLGPVNAFGTQFGIFSLAFNTADGLNFITFHSEARISPDDCKKNYLKLLSGLEAQYGSFAPLGNGLLPCSKTSVHEIAVTSSEYRLAGNPADPGYTGGEFRMDAVHTFGPRYLTVMTSDIEAPPGNAVCHTEVQFVQPHVEQ